MRKKIIAGNWKMNMLPNETLDYIDKFSKLVTNSENEIILCVPFTDLFYALMAAQETNIKIGAQNMYYKENGAYTGEVSGEMLKAVGAEYVIVAHSERRKYFGEAEEIANRKIKVALANGLTPIYCIGETIEQRDLGMTDRITSIQTACALVDLTDEDVKKIIIAYEPVWAIGTGKTPTAEEANNAIKAIRNEIKRLYNEDVSESVRILYGGSVKSSNAKELFETSDIDGGLVGGASLDPEEFAKIVNYNTKN